MAARYRSVLDVRITPDQDAAIRAWSKATRFPVSDVVRELLPSTPPGVEDADAVQDLRERIAESLTQERELE